MSKTQAIICRNCAKEHIVSNIHAVNGLYCSNSCQQEFQHKKKIADWLSKGIKPTDRTIKRYLVETIGKCTGCGISEWLGKPLTLELEHIDGNSENSELNNLTLLCPNCHSQTATYKGANRGQGRHARRVRYSEGKSY